MDDCDCGNCDGDCCGSCDCSDCLSFGLGWCAADCCASNSRNNRVGDCPPPCFWIVILFIFGGIIFAISSCEKEKKEKEKNQWRIVEIQKEGRLFFKDDNTVLENIETKKRKIVSGKLGKVDEVIIYK